MGTGLKIWYRNWSVRPNTCYNGRFTGEDSIGNPQQGAHKGVQQERLNQIPFLIRAGLCRFRVDILDNFSGIFVYPLVPLRCLPGLQVRGYQSVAPEIDRNYCSELRAGNY